MIEECELCNNKTECTISDGIYICKKCEDREILKRNPNTSDERDNYIFEQELF